LREPGFTTSFFPPWRQFHFACNQVTGATRCLTPAYKF
jgi:hypothetical protein